MGRSNSQTLILGPKNYKAVEIWLDNQLKWRFEDNTIVGFNGALAPIGGIPYGANIIVAGDSLSSVGGGDSDDVEAGEEWAAVLMGLSAFRNRNCKLINTAVGGYTMASLEADYEDEVLPYRPSVTGKPAILIVAGGPGNSLAADETANDTHELYQAYCERAESHGFIVWKCTVWPRIWSAARFTEWLSFNQQVRGGDYGSRLIDFAQLLSNPNDTQYFDADKLHFNPNGMRVNAEYVNYLATHSDAPVMGTPDYVSASTVRGVAFEGVTLTLNGSAANAPLSILDAGTPFGTIWLGGGSTDATSLYFATKTGGDAGARQYLLSNNADSFGHFSLYISTTATASPSVRVWNVDAAGGFNLQTKTTAALPFILPTYTVATLPNAATYARGLIYVSDGTSNKRLAISDGTNWRFPDGNIVS